MFTKRIAILIVASFLAVGSAGLAQAAEKGKTVSSQEQVRTTEQHRAQIQAGDPAGTGVGDRTMTRERTRTREQLRDGTGDQGAGQLRTRDRTRERIHDHLGPGPDGAGSGMTGPGR